MSSRNPDFEKRKLIEAAVLADVTNEKSNRDLAKEFGCTHGLVGSVKREMVAANLIPPLLPRKFERQGTHQPGQSARGGYVYDEIGKRIKESEWNARQERIWEGVESTDSTPVGEGPVTANPMPTGVPIAGRGRGTLQIVSDEDEDFGEYS